jgi:hypothetical protein
MVEVVEILSKRLEQEISPKIFLKKFKFAKIEQIAC